MSDVSTKQLSKNDEEMVDIIKKKRVKFATPIESTSKKPKVKVQVPQEVSEIADLPNVKITEEPKEKLKSKWKKKQEKALQEKKTKEKQQKEDSTTTTTTTTTQSIFDCPICKNVFESSTSLQNHTKLHHNKNVQKKKRKLQEEPVMLRKPLLPKKRGKKE